jgi:GGDEF domain-containing protein
MAERILTALSEEGMLVAGAPFSVSVGIAACDGNGAEFARMHRDAETALRQARSDGERIGMATPSEACRPQKPDEDLVEKPFPSRARRAG